MLILAIIGMLFFGWIYWLIVKIPLIAYGALGEWLHEQESAATCQLCRARWASLGIVGKTLTHSHDRVKQVLDREETELQTCSSCGGRGAVPGRQVVQRMHGNDFVDVSEPTHVDCPKCGGVGEWPEVVNRIYKDVHYQEHFYDFTIHCDTCGETYVQNRSTPPQFPKNSVRTKVTRSLHRGLMKGMVAGLFVAFVGSVAWSAKTAWTKGVGDGSANDWVMALMVFFMLASGLSVGALIVGALWGAVMSVLGPPLAMLIDERTYLYAAISGGLSLALLAFAVDSLFGSLHVGGRDPTVWSVTVAYSLLVVIGAVAFCGGKLGLTWIERGKAAGARWGRRFI